ncbi:MAG: Uncharacterized protein G01um101424_118 [Parcubacteria group bacterium Gr01-1014_24]|nr:MAG: Uncharacterized protein G01um101424_118 [Parcubacteria group bacterium Gr01-1014_24]
MQLNIEMKKKAKKIIPYCLILIAIFALVGLFNPAGEAQAQTPPPITTTGCYNVNNQIQGTPPLNQSQCLALGSSVRWVVVAGTPTPASPRAAGEDSELTKNIPGCAVITGDFDDCIVKISYYLFYSLPSFLLGIVASIFNVVLSISLSSSLYTKSPFIPEAWAVVRDLSNIFFILILLYIGIKIILGLGGSEVKKMIAQIIIMALLINFSMFFTKIVIDASNILALIFYNKIDTEVKITTGSTNMTTTGRDYLPITNPAITGNVEKDIAGGLASAFKPGEMLTPTFFEKAATRTIRAPSLSGAAAYTLGGALAGSFIPVVGTAIGAGVGIAGYAASTIFGLWTSEPVPNSLLFGIIVTSGAIMFFAIYAFFISGMSFIGRLIELWILIIASPFAFMSSTVPLLSGIPHVGWKEWLKRLLQVSFMAPIFMFFLYLIFKLVSIDVFGDIAARGFADQGTFEAIALLSIKAIIILILLLKATSFAKKWSGQLGEMMMKGVAIAGGIAGGLAIGGTASVLQASVGKYSDRFAESTTAKRWIREGRFGADTLQKMTSYLGGASFDARKGVAGAALGAVSSVTGLDLGAKSQLLLKKDGGYREDRKKAVEKRMQRAQELEVGEDEELTRNLHELEEQKQGLLRDVSHDIEQLDNRIKTWRDRSRDRAERVRVLNGDPNATQAERGAAAVEAREAVDNLRELNTHRRAIKDGENFTPTAVSAINLADVGVVQAYSTRARVGGVATGASINQLEDTFIPQVQHEIERENRDRKWAYANYTEMGGGGIRNFFRAIGLQRAGDNEESRREAAHKIIMEAKVEDKGGEHS